MKTCWKWDLPPCFVFPVKLRTHFLHCNTNVLLTNSSFTFHGARIENLRANRGRIKFSIYFSAQVHKTILNRDLSQSRLRSCGFGPSVRGYQYYGRTYRLHLYHFYSEDGGDIFSETLVITYTGSQSRRPHLTVSLLMKLVGGRIYQSMFPCNLLPTVLQ
jgi:hypothetical protein